MGVLEKNKTVRLLFPIFLFLLGVYTCTAQSSAHSAYQKPITVSTDFADMENVMADLANTIINDTVYAHRLEANEKLVPLMRHFLSTPQSFDYAFKKLEAISVLQPADKSFRLISWAFYTSDVESKHFGFIQLNKPKPTFIELKEQMLNVNSIPLDETLTAENWLGALYYNIKPFKTKGGTKYLLFGLNLGNGAEKTKMCEVLTVKGNHISLGAPVFENTEKHNTKKKYRIAITFSGEAGMRLNYDEEMKEIVFDHVQEVPTNEGMTYVPDGTYEAYQLKKGVWQYIEKLANTEMSEAPRPKPVLGQRIKVRDANRDEAKSFQWPEKIKN